MRTLQQVVSAPSSGVVDFGPERVPCFPNLPVTPYFCRHRGRSSAETNPFWSTKCARERSVASTGHCLHWIRYQRFAWRGGKSMFTVLTLRGGQASLRFTSTSFFDSFTPVFLLTDSTSGDCNNFNQEQPPICVFLCDSNAFLYYSVNKFYWRILPKSECVIFVSPLNSFRSRVHGVCAVHNSYQARDSPNNDEKEMTRLGTKWGSKFARIRRINVYEHYVYAK